MSDCHRPKPPSRCIPARPLPRPLSRSFSRYRHCYLEASSDDSRRFYARHGFALKEELCVLPLTASDAAGAPLLYIMVRPPQGAGAGGAGGGGGGAGALAAGVGGKGAAAAGAAVGPVAAPAKAAEVVVTAAGGIAATVAVPEAAAAAAASTEPQKQTAAAAAEAGQAGERARQGDEQV